MSEIALSRRNLSARTVPAGTEGLAGRADVMGRFVNGRLTRIAALLAAAVVLALNFLLLGLSFGLV